MQSPQANRVIHYAPMNRYEAYCGRAIQRAYGTPRTDTVTCKDCRAAMVEGDECGNCGAVATLGQVCECAGGTEGSGDWDEDASVQS